MSLDISKVAIKTAISACFGNNCNDIPGAHDFLKELAEDAEELRINAGEYVFGEKDASDYVYIPVSGAVMLERSTKAGDRQVFAFMFTGNILGLSDTPQYTFSAKTLTDSVLIKFSASLIKRMFDKFPHFAERYHNIFSHILAVILDQLFIIGQKTAHQRLAYFLLDMKQRIGHGTNKFYLPMSRQDIADYLGMSLETASRGFSKLKKDKLIRVENNYQVTLLEQSALKEFAEV